MDPDRHDRPSMSILFRAVSVLLGVVLHDSLEELLYCVRLLPLLGLLHVCNETQSSKQCSKTCQNRDWMIDDDWTS